MIYGYKFMPNIDNTLSISEQTFGFSSIVYDEYMNRCNILENTIDTRDKTILEAQIEILQEVSFKDIKEKIKNIFRRIAKFLKSIIDKIKSFFYTLKLKKRLRDFDDFEDDFDFSFSDDEIEEISNAAAKSFEEMSKDLDEIFNSIYDGTENAYDESTIMESEDSDKYYSNTGSTSANKTIRSALFQTIAKNPILLIEDCCESDLNELKIITQEVDKICKSNSDNIFDESQELFSKVRKFTNKKKDFAKQLESADAKVKKVIYDSKMISIVKTIDNSSKQLEKRLEEYESIAEQLSKSINYMSSRAIEGCENKESLEAYVSIGRTIDRLNKYIRYQIVNYSKAAGAASVLFDYLSNINNN